MKTIIEHSIHWHNFINGSADPDDMIEQAEYCLSVTKILKEGLESDTIQIIGSDSSPSLTMWDVLNEEEYAKICEKHGIDPKELEFELEVEDEYE